MTQPMLQPQAVDETSVFVVEPDGWYGVLSLRSPVVRRIKQGESVPDGEDWLQSKYGAWIPRLLDEVQGINWISCVPVMQCWHATFSRGHLNEFALTMLSSLAVHKPEIIVGPVVFTGQGNEMGAPVGLRPEQLEPIAAAYRLAQRNLMATG